MKIPNRLNQKICRIWAVLCLAVKKYWNMDGGQWAAAFAFNAFLSLFPSVVLFVTIVSVFIDQDRAAKAIIASMEHYIPIRGEMQSYIFDTIAGVVHARRQASAIALLILIWVTLQCFTTLISATNRAWGAAVIKWWRLPLKGLVLLVITAVAVLLGVSVPAVMGIAKGWLFAVNGIDSWVAALGSIVIPWLVVFFGMSLFYRLAPRRPMQFAQVWAAALVTTILLQTAEILFITYLKYFVSLNAVYGTLGGLMALLLWIYICGCIVIFGACLGAGQAEMHSLSVKTTVVRAEGRNIS